MGRGNPGCDLDPALSIKGVRHPRWGGERGEPGLYLLRGSAGHLFFQLLVVAIALQPRGGDVLQPCRGRRTVATQLGCNIPPSPLHSRRGRQRGPPVRLGAARSLALIAGSRPLSGTANESPPVATSTRDHGCCCRGRWQVPRRSLPRRLEIAHTRGGQNQSSVCNGTLNASVFVHYGCRGLNMYVILARSRVFPHFRALRLAC
jgi:hypothetical protein